MDTVTKKIKQFQALLGDDAAKEVLAEAERRETAAKEAGIDFKETGKARTKAEDETKPVSLAALLEQIEAGLEKGLITDDLAEAEESDDGQTDESGEVDLEAMGKEIAEYVDARVKEALDKLEAKIDTRLKSGFMPRHKEAETQVTELRAEMDKTAKALQAQQVQLAELMGLRPTRIAQKGYRASQDESNVREKEVAEVQRPDPVGDFISEIFNSEPAF